jgi:hypothetical protein
MSSRFYNPTYHSGPVDDLDPRKVVLIPASRIQVRSRPNSPAHQTATAHRFAYETGRGGGEAPDSGGGGVPGGACLRRTGRSTARRRRGSRRCRRRSSAGPSPVAPPCPADYRSPSRTAHAGPPQPHRRRTRGTARDPLPRGPWLRGAGAAS